MFVVFKRIYESPPGQDEREREAEEKRRDTELAAEIAQRKKNTNERGIKLTAVLMASRKMLGVCVRLGTMQMEGVLIPS